MSKKPSLIYQIKVILDNTHPPIWRRFLVPGNTSLLKLHDIIQIVMGWENAHLHMFKIEGLTYSCSINGEYDDFGDIDEAGYKLNQVINRVGQRFNYEYDFGDSWSHTLIVEKIFPPQEGMLYPICLKGRRSCPPEDVGGIWGYENFLEAIRDPSHDDHEEYLNWIGDEFDPGAFDLGEVNALLRSMGRGRSTEVLNSWFMDGNEPAGMSLELDSPWPQTLSEAQRLVAEELPLRRDVITLLTYLRDHKVTGTQSTGNLPLKAVYEICAQFVDPPELETAIGDHIFRVRSEIEVWPLYFKHVLASVGGFITGGLGRRWKLTPFGEQFLAAPASSQVWHLLALWWMQTNWAIASPFSSEDGYMPYGFTRIALKHLLGLPVGKPASFDRFADQMIEESRMVRPIENQESARFILHSIIEFTVINPLVDFGILQSEYKPHKTFGEEFSELYTFRITPFGIGLIEAINGAMNQD